MKRKITAIIIGLCATVCATVAASVVTKVNGSGGAVWSDVEISEVYAYGDTLAVPDRTLTIDGNGVKSLYTVTFPSGKTVRTKSVKLNETRISNTSPKKNSAFRGSVTGLTATKVR